MTDDLTELIREVIAAYPDAQVPELAQYAAKMTPEMDVMRFYEQALHRMIPEVIRSGRNAALTQVFHPRPQQPHKPGQPLSYKLAGIASGWQRLMQEKVPVQLGVNKPLGECTVADLDYAIKVREDQITAVKVKISQYTQLRAHLIASGVETLGQTQEMQL